MKGMRGRQRRWSWLSHPLGFLATAQIGISLAGILAGVYGGATIAERLASVLVTIPILAPYSQAISVTVVVLTITYLSLVLGELAPKRVALANPERIAAPRGRADARDGCGRPTSGSLPQRVHRLRDSPHGRQGCR